MDCIPNSFLICLPPDVENASSLHMAEFCMFIWVLCLDQSQAEVIKSCVYCRVNWLGCKCKVYPFPLGSLRVEFLTGGKGVSVSSISDFSHQSCSVLDDDKEVVYFQITLHYTSHSFFTCLIGSLLDALYLPRHRLYLLSKCYSLC